MAVPWHSTNLAPKITYLNDKAKSYVEPLTQKLQAQIVMPLNVSRTGELEAVFRRITIGAASAS
jgi:enoyl-[acyl-carrier-protein] reductase (NADH)